MQTAKNMHILQVRRNTVHGHMLARQLVCVVNERIACLIIHAKLLSSYIMADIKYCPQIGRWQAVLATVLLRQELSCKLGLSKRDRMVSGKGGTAMLCLGKSLLTLKTASWSCIRSISVAECSPLLHQRDSKCVPLLHNFQRVSHTLAIICWIQINLAFHFPCWDAFWGGLVEMCCE